MGAGITHAGIITTTTVAGIVTISAMIARMAACIHCRIRFLISPGNPPIANCTDRRISKVKVRERTPPIRTVIV